MTTKKNKPIPICAWITDTHSREDNYQLVENIFDQVVEHCEKIECGILVHGGDFFQERFPGNPLNSQLSVIRNIQLVGDKGMTFYAIPGNHDKTEYTSEKSYLDVVKYCHKSFKLFSKPNYVNINNEIRFAFLPYFKEGELVLQHLVELIDAVKVSNENKQRKTILFYHGAIFGAKNNDGTTVENDIEQDFFNEFDLVLVGHYHNRNSLNKKIHYTGSSHQKDFGEDDRKGFAIIYSDLSIKYIPTTYPKFINVTINIANREELSKKIREYEGTKDKVKFILKGSQEELSSYDTAPLEAAGINVKKINTVELLVNFEQVEDAEIVIHDKKNIMKSWVEYADGVDLTPPQKKNGLKHLQQL